MLELFFSICCKTEKDSGVEVTVLSVIINVPKLEVCSIILIVKCTYTIAFSSMSHHKRKISSTNLKLSALFLSCWPNFTVFCSFFTLFITTAFLFSGKTRLDSLVCHSINSFHLLGCKYIFFEIIFSLLHSRIFCEFLMFCTSLAPVCHYEQLLNNMVFKIELCHFCATHKTV